MIIHPDETVCAPPPQKVFSLVCSVNSTAYQCGGVDVVRIGHPDTLPAKFNWVLLGLLGFTFCVARPPDPSLSREGPRI